MHIYLLLLLKKNGGSYFSENVKFVFIVFGVFPLLYYVINNTNLNIYCLRFYLRQINFVFIIFIFLVLSMLIMASGILPPGRFPPHSSRVARAGKSARLLPENRGRASLRFF